MCKPLTHGGKFQNGRPASSSNTNSCEIISLHILGDSTIVTAQDVKAIKTIGALF